MRPSAGGLSNRANRPIYTFLLVAASVGILLDRYADIPLRSWLGCLITAVVGWLLSYRLSRFRLASWLILLAMIALAGTWHHCRWNLFHPDDLGLLANDSPRPVRVVAIVLTQPQPLGKPDDNPFRPYPATERTRFQVRVVRRNNGTNWQPARGCGMVWVHGQLLGVRPGDEVELLGQLERLAPARNPGQRSLRDLERGHRRLFRLTVKYPANVQVLRQGHGIGSWVPRIRAACDDLLWKHLSHRRHGLAAAVLLGAREGIARDQAEAFFLTGTIHLLAISGLHVTILALFFHQLARSGLIRQNRMMILIILLTCAYTILVASRPPVIRACILVTVFCLARILHVRTHPFNSLSAAALIVLAINPTQLFSAGAQLSFLAVAALAWLAPRLLEQPPIDPLVKLVRQTRPWPQRLVRRAGITIGHAFLVGAMIWSVALPLVAYRWHIVSPVALLLNVVLWIPISLALLSGFGLLVFGWIIPPVGALCGWCCDTNLGLLESVVQWGRDLPGSHFWISGFPFGATLVFYTVLLVVIVHPTWRRYHVRGIAAAYLLMFLATVWIDWQGGLHQSQRPLQCSFLAVGHGTCVVLQLPNGQVGLYDAGGLGDPRFPTDIIARFLWSQRIGHLDFVVLSHADADHYNGLPGLAERFSITQVFVGPEMFSDHDVAIDALRQCLLDRKITVKTIVAGQSIPTTGQTAIRVLHPPATGVEGSDNANSIVLLVEYRGRSILLPGDLEKPGLQLATKTYDVDCDVAMAPHHGSARSQQDQFAKWSRPQWTIISDSHRYSHAKTKAILRDRQCRVWDTSRDGAMRVTIEGNDLKVTPWIPRAIQY